MLSSTFAALAFVDRVFHPHATAHFGYGEVDKPFRAPLVDPQLSLAFAHPALLRLTARQNRGLVGNSFANDVPIVVTAGSLVYPNADLHTGRGVAHSVSVLEFRRFLPKDPRDSCVRDRLELSLSSRAYLGSEQLSYSVPLLELRGNPDVEGFRINELSIGDEKVAALPRRVKAALNTLASVADKKTNQPVDKALDEIGDDMIARSLLHGAQAKLIRSFGSPR